jgi:Fe-S cluster assembly ATP-binding protein
MPGILEIQDLHVRVAEKELLKGVNLVIRQGEIHALMGPNGTGKSTLAYALMGHPGYSVTGGKILMDGMDLAAFAPEERARMGLFLAFQYPVAVSGVSVANFLRTAINARRRAADPQDKGISIPEFRKMLKSKMELLQIPADLAGRYLNEGFSGGEKKRVEVLQLAVLLPRIAVLDETDSGLDIDALRIVAGGVEAISGTDLGILVITHYQRILNYIKPQYVHVMLDGRIVESGGSDLALRLEQQGYDWVREKHSGAPKD